MDGKKSQTDFNRAERNFMPAFIFCFVVEDVGICCIGFAAPNETAIQITIYAAAHNTTLW
jgi:hypothetical protein